MVVESLLPHPQAQERVRETEGTHCGFSTSKGLRSSSFLVGHRIPNGTNTAISLVKTWALPHDLKTVNRSVACLHGQCGAVKECPSLCPIHLLNGPGAWTSPRSECCIGVTCLLSKYFLHFAKIICSLLGTFRRCRKERKKERERRAINSSHSLYSHFQKPVSAEGPVMLPGFPLTRRKGALS